MVSKTRKKRKLGGQQQVQPKKKSFFSGVGTWWRGRKMGRLLQNMQKLISKMDPTEKQSFYIDFYHNYGGEMCNLNKNMMSSVAQAARSIQSNVIPQMQNNQGTNYGRQSGNYGQSGLYGQSGYPVNNISNYNNPYGGNKTRKKRNKTNKKKRKIIKTKRKRN